MGKTGLERSAAFLVALGVCGAFALWVIVRWLDDVLGSKLFSSGQGARPRSTLSGEEMGTNPDDRVIEAIDSNEQMRLLAEALERACRYVRDPETFSDAAPEATEQLLAASDNLSRAIGDLLAARSDVTEGEPC